MLDFYTLEQKEEWFLKQEEIQVKRIKDLTQAQENFKMWDGFRNDKGYAEQLKKAIEKLATFRDENVDFLI